MSLERLRCDLPSTTSSCSRLSGDESSSDVPQSLCGLLVFFFWPPSLLPSVQICGKAFQYCWYLLPALALLQLGEIWQFRPCCRVPVQPHSAPCLVRRVAYRRPDSTTSTFSMQLEAFVCACACACMCLWSLSGLQTHHCTVKENLIHI